MQEPEHFMKHFSLEEQEKLRTFLFTNPHGDVSFVYPQPLVAGEELSPLMSAYSRTHVPMQKRVLQLLDGPKQEQTREMMPLVDPLMEVFRHPDGTLKISKKTSGFNKEWVLKHGHSSIKEETALFGHCENISDIALKKVTGHPLNKPQVKSTRYLSYGKVLDLGLEDPDLLALPNAEEAIEHVRYLNQRYRESTKDLGDAVFAHPDTARVAEYLRQPEQVQKAAAENIARKQRMDDDFKPTEADWEKERTAVLKSLDSEGVRKQVGKFVLDYSRVHLLPVTRSSLGYSIDARTLEEVITDMISSPRKEDRSKGYEIWDEAKKVAPVLLGERSHINIDQWRVKNEAELREYFQEKFAGLPLSIHGTGAVNLLTPQNMEMYTDRFNAALAVFPYLDASLTDIVSTLEEKDIKEVLEKVHAHRGSHDVIHNSISHGGMMVEMTMAYHAYRDMFRQRRGSRSTQLLTTRLGFEIPEIFKVFGMDDQYLQDMARSEEVYEEARKHNPHAAEKLVPFGANCRALHSWQTNQVGYVGKLRGDVSKGNISYVDMTHDMMNAVSEVMPLTAEQFKWNKKTYPLHLWKAGYEWFDETQRDK